MRIGILLLILVNLLLSAGCTGVQNQGENPAFFLSPDGNLSLEVPLAKSVSEVVNVVGNVTVEELTFITETGNVSAVLISPSHPVAGVVWAPGAGVPAAGHIDHLLAYGYAGYAVLVVDIRGNGGKTPGYPLNLEADYEKLISGKEWPQVYLIVADLIGAERYLHDRFGSIPVWAAGESNGGRYAAQAVASDSGFFGYVGISTSGFDRQGDQYEGTARSFLLSVDPQALAGQINPRPSFIFHAPGDQIIPIESGEKLATALGNSAQFIKFNGTHGVNGEVDQFLISRFNTYYR